MADKFIRHGATFNGDGTSSALATVDGGVGAWNNINVLTGTAPAYGALAAGDVVYIRSKDAGGSNISVAVTSAVNLGAAAATSGSWITWVLDAGTVWGGISGTLTFSHASTWSMTPRAYNRFVADVPNAFALVVTGTGDCSAMLSVPAAPAVMENWLFDASGQTGGGVAGFYFGAAYAKLTLVNPDIRFRAMTANGLMAYYPVELVMFNPTITVNSAGGTRLFFVNDQLRVWMYGGEIKGAYAASGSLSMCASVGNQYVGEFRLIGTKYPVLMPMHTETTMHVLARFESVLCDGDVGLGFGAEFMSAYASMSSRNDGNFPTLSAFLPDSAVTPWSWRVRPYNANSGYPLELTVAKYFADTTGVKTVKLELLHSNGYTGLTKDNCWIEVSYIDNSTGLPKAAYSRAVAAGALDTSSASWSSTSYGLVSCTSGKKSLSVTTPTSVKQNTMITLRFCCTAIPPSTSDCIFLCPDLVIS